MGCHALLQGIFPTQGWDSSLPRLLHYRWILLPIEPARKPEHWCALSQTQGLASVRKGTQESIVQPQAVTGWLPDATAGQRGTLGSENFNYKPSFPSHMKIGMSR